MLKSRSPILLFALSLACLAPAIRPTGAAEFDIDSQRTILRQLQYCLDCGSALLVTQVHPGVMVRCPDCGREQPRLANEHVLTQIYQLCDLCHMPLDAKNHRPGEVVECGNCHSRQVLSRDVFPAGAQTAGLGYAPGFPPGSSKKHLLHSPERPDGPITPAPLETAEDSPLPELAHAPPPASYARLDIPEPPPQAPPQPVAVPAPAARPSGSAVDVPAVSVDLFGGKRSGAPREKPAAATLSGDLAARVDGSPIYAADIDRIADPVMARLRQQATPEQAVELAARERELRKEILERLIDRELVIREAARIGHRPELAAVRRRENELARLLGDGADIRREAERDVIMNDMRLRFAEKPGAASPEAVREFYRANLDRLQRERLLALGQLVIFQDRAGRPDPRNCMDIAAEVTAALERGEKFDDLRRRHDEFPAAAGLDVPSVMLPETAYAAQVLLSGGALRKGAVFGPVRMEGMVLFGKVVDERPAGPIPFEEVEKDIRRRLESEAAEKALDEWLGHLRRRGVVELFVN